MSLWTSKAGKVATGANSFRLHGHLCDSGRYMATTRSKRRCWLLTLQLFPLLANGKLICSCGIVSTLGGESQPIWISSAYPGALDWFKDGSGPTWGWQILMTHLLGNPSKYFIPEKREAQKRTALLSLLLPCLVTCHTGIQYWIMINVLHPWGNHIGSGGMCCQGSVLLTQVSCLYNNCGATQTFTC